MNTGFVRVRLLSAPRLSTAIEMGKHREVNLTLAST